MSVTAKVISVEGLRVLVTGGTRGIGRAIAEAFSQEGASVVVTGRDAARAGAAAAQIGAEATGHALDVASEESVLALTRRLQDSHGGIDVLVNSAGINPHYAYAEETSSEDWSAVLRTNLDGSFFCCKHFGSAMLARGKGGAIINISSIAGSMGLKRQAPYCASKGGVEQLTRALAMDWAARGVRVNAIGYGFIKTDLTSGMTGHPHIAPRLLARMPMNRFGELREVAGAALFLASSAASYVTGHTLMVDGGWAAA